MLAGPKSSEKADTRSLVTCDGFRGVGGDVLAFGQEKGSQDDVVHPTGAVSLSKALDPVGNETQFVEDTWWKKWR